MNCKWKERGYCQKFPRPKKHSKLGLTDRRVLREEIRKKSTKSMGRIHEEFQLISVSLVSINTIRNEAQVFGFNRRSTPHKPLITKFNSAGRTTWCKEQHIAPWNSGKGSLGRRIMVLPALFGFQALCLGYDWRKYSARNVLTSY